MQQNIFLPHQTLVKESATSSSTQVMETRSCQNKVGPSRNISEIINTVFHDEHTDEINNQQEEDCDVDDECTFSGPDMNSSEGK